MTRSTGLAAEGVTVRLGGRAVLSGVSVQARPGQLQVLAGANGAGKSTLLSVLAGLRRPDGGEVTLDGRPLRRFQAQELARRRAVQSQRDRLEHPFLAREVVALGRFAHGDVDARSARVDRALARAGVSHLADRPMTELSGGERQRVHLARALAQVDGVEAGILLLDEPTSALDLRAQQLVLALLADAAHTDGLAVVAVLHDLNLAAAWADRLLLLAGGQILADGARAAHAPAGAGRR